MKLTRPLIFLDIESATANPNRPDPQKDRIIELAGQKFFPSDKDDWDDPMEMIDVVNPGIPINEKCTEIHGFTNEKVADLGGFELVAHKWFNWIKDADLAGFGIWFYDLPLLVAEFARCSVSLCWRSRKVIDASIIYKKLEERTLTAAARFYCNCDHDGAHGAMADTRMAVKVFRAQRDRYPDLGKMGLDDLHKFSQHDERLTLDGAIVKGPDGDPIYTIGKNTRGVKVKDDPAFADWMLYRASFPRDTCEWLEAYLQSLQTPVKPDQDDMFV